MQQWARVVLLSTLGGLPRKADEGGMLAMSVCACVCECAYMCGSGYMPHFTSCWRGGGHTPGVTCREQESNENQECNKKTEIYHRSKIKGQFMHVR